ncbi:MAG: phage tail protein [Anaerolineales bacterium]|nr:phage tail protein [Anaerolineales bacterium]
MKNFTWILFFLFVLMQPSEAHAGWFSSVLSAAGSFFNSPIFTWLSPIVSIVSIAMMAISWLNKPDEPDFNVNEPTPEQRSKGILANKTSGIASLPVIYGMRKVGGNIVFLETSGTDNEFLYMIFAMAEGICESCESIYIDDKLVTWSGALTDGTARTVGAGDSNFYKDSTSHISATWYDGDDSQTYDTTVGSLSSWTSNHRLRGVSYLAFKFTWNQDIFSAIPNVKAIIKGRKVYNPNLDGTKTGGSGSHREDTVSTHEWSNNPAYCLLDYLRNARYGMGIANANFDDDYADWQTAGDVCDTDVTAYTGTTIDIFDCNAVLDTKSKVIKNVKDLLSGCRGYLNYTGGKYKLLIEGTGSASITLTEDNIIGGIGISSKDKNTRFNRVICTFVNPDKNYTSDEAQYPPIDDSGEASADQHANMKTADGGILLEGRFDLPTCTSPYQSMETAEVILRRSRSSLEVSLKADSTALDLAIGDIVNITHATPSFSAKAFRVMGMTINSDLTCDLQLVEHQDSYYTWATKTEVATIPTTTLPNPYSVVAPASVTLTDELIEYNDGTVITRLNILVGASTDKFVQYYQVEAKLSTESDYKIISQGTQLNHEMINVIDAKIYNVRVKAINSLGVNSDYTSANRTIVGSVAPPSDVTNFAINIINDEAHLTWTAISDLDLDYYIIRYSTATSGATWQNSIELADRIARPATTAVFPLKTGSYLIKARDKLGNESNNETIITTNIASVNYSSVSTVNEHTGFSGTKSSVSATTIDGTVYLALTASGTLGASDTTVPTSGSYLFNNSIDLGAKYKAQVSANITQTIQDVADFFDNRSGNFDDASAPFDGASTSNCTTQLQVATSDDNVTYSSYSTFVVGEYEARYLKFQVLFTSTGTARSMISALSVTASVPIRREFDSDVSSTTGVKAITFTHAFKTSPAIGISAQGLATGDFYSITSKSVSGFSIQFKNSGGSGVDRTFDWLAEGAGQVIT